MLLVGGKTESGERTDVIEEFDPANGTATEIAQLPTGLSGFAAVEQNNHLFVIGGNDSRVRASVDVLDLDTLEWSRGPPLNEKRDELAATLGPDGHIYAVGGYSAKNNQCLLSAERLAPGGSVWEVLPAMNDRRRALACVSLPDGVYAVGGFNGTEYLSSVERFDEERGEWMLTAPMGRRRCTLGAVSSSDCRYIYALGGFDGAAMASVERYDVIKDEWEEVASMNVKRFMHSAVTVKVKNEGGDLLS